MYIFFSVILLLSQYVSVLEPNHPQNYPVVQLSPQGRQAYRLLLSSEIFHLGPIGWGGDISKEELALKQLLLEKNAVEAFNELARKGSYEGGLYGLVGLHLSAPKEFDAALLSYESKGEPPARRLNSYSYLLKPGEIVAGHGCVTSNQNWHEVISRIKSGSYDQMVKTGEIEH